MSADHRSYGMQQIFRVIRKRGYKDETLFKACGIFDRFIYLTGLENFNRNTIFRLIPTCVLLAAKIEESI